LNKAQRLLYGDSEMTHAMVFTAIHEEVIQPLLVPETTKFS
jgi:aminopeptidase C